MVMLFLSLTDTGILKNKNAKDSQQESILQLDE